MQTRLAFATCLADLLHTGENIMKLTYEGFHACGIGKYDEDVKDCIHMCTSDEGSNMKKACKKIEGAGCVCHRKKNGLERRFLLNVLSRC